jgi:hypothetical protein
VTAPTGTVTINNDAATTNNRAVTLTLSATDGTNPVATMRFSWDGVNFYAWEPYATTRSATLPAGDGTKTIFVRFADTAGNVSLVYQDSIVLDTTAPTGSVAINNGATTTTTRPVTLTLTATDTASAVTNIRFSWNNGPFYAWEPYAITRNANIPGATQGTYTICVQLRDAAGNVSPAYCDSITYAP